MKHVKIYIYTSIRTMKKNSGAAGYVLSYTTKNNLEATLSNIEYLEDMSVYDSEIEILCRALKRLNTKSLIVDIYAESKYLESSINYWLDKYPGNASKKGLEKETSFTYIMGTTNIVTGLKTSVNQM